MKPRFRAWHKTCEEMGRIAFIRYRQSGEIAHLSFRGNTYSGLVKLDEIELMQSTGFKDKNGKEIFEGDVVRQVRTQPTTENETITGVVTMIEGAWLIMNDCEQLASYLWSETDENEIIGNIYENPELLEEGK
ncbi:YopX family protein [Streptococcus mitis]|uniref:YopX family protein n=1 Tax=Streptococcus mitis TaxID=28037 RepID=UPI0039F055E7